MKSLVAALAFALMAVVTAAIDVSGTWNVDGDVVGNPVKFVCTLKQVDDKLTGSAAIEGNPITITGAVRDNTVTFQFDVNHQGSIYTNVFTGTLKDGGVLTGTIAVGGVEGAFTAKKQ